MALIQRNDVMQFTMLTVRAYHHTVCVYSIDDRLLKPLPRAF